MPGAPFDLPPAADLLAAATVVSLPMALRFRGVEHREAVLLHGPAGWGEFAPFPEYGDEESARWLAAAVEAAWGAWPAPVRDAVAVNATVPAVPPDRVAAVLARYDGCTTAKVKVAEAGQTLQEDLARVAEVRAVLGPAGRIRVDANGRWTVEQALEALTAFAHHDLEYAEQPCATVAELATLRRELARRGVDVPVAADESVRRAEDPLRVARAEAADILVMKVQPLGGIHRCLELAEEAGLPVVVSSALETSVGLSAGLALAAALPQLPHASGLATASLLTGDLVRESLLPAGGEIPLARPRPETELLQRHRAGETLERDWELRLAQCAALL